MQFRGCGTALVTPFRQDGSIDESALRHLVEWQVEAGIDFLVPCGTTGETPTLSHDEWLQVIDTTIEVVAGRVPIVAGATSNSTQDAVEKAKELAARAGVNGILTASPYYNKPTQRASTVTSEPSLKRWTSQSFSTTSRAAPARTSSPARWHDWPRSRT